MAGRIPEAFIQQLLERVDIVQVIQPRVSLKRAGREYQACCPFHNEKTPSFTVSPDKQFYHCFGCGAHGSAIRFLMQYEGLSFPEAVEELASLAGMDVPREGGDAQPSRRLGDLTELMQWVTGWYRKQLQLSEPARNYLKQRGLKQAVIDGFALGFAPDRWDALQQALPGQTKLLQQAGLVSTSDSGRHYDRFRNRLLFPIHNRRGQVIGFGGRLLEGDGPKYLNSPETPLFHKGRELYGLWQARKLGHTREQILVVEGYMDVLALVQAGFANTVATLGTATTEEQVLLLFRASRHILYCFDGDRAGREAAWKALLNTLPQMQDGRQVSFLFLPEGDDPDSLVRQQGAAAMETRIRQAVPLEQFLLQQLTRKSPLNRLDTRAQLAREAQALIQRIPPGHYRNLLTEQVEHRLGVNLQAMPTAEAASHTSGANLNTPLRTAIALLLDDPTLARLEAVDQIGLEADEPGSRLLIQLLQQCRQQAGITTGQLLEWWHERPEGEHLQRLAAAVLPQDNRPRVFEDALRKIRQQQISDKIELLRQRMAETAEPDSQTVLQLQALLQEKRKLNAPR